MSENETINEEIIDKDDKKTEWVPPFGYDPYTSNELKAKFNSLEWRIRSQGVLNESINKLRYEKQEKLKSITFLTYYNMYDNIYKTLMYIGGDTVRIIREWVDDCGRDRKEKLEVNALNGTVLVGDHIVVGINNVYPIVEIRTMRKKDWEEVFSIID